MLLKKRKIDEKLPSNLWLSLLPSSAWLIKHYHLNEDMIVAVAVVI